MMDYWPLCLRVMIIFKLNLLVFMNSLVNTANVPSNLSKARAFLWARHELTSRKSKLKGSCTC